MAQYIAKWPNQHGQIAWTAQENTTWQQLLTRQLSIVEARACPEFMHGLEQIGFDEQNIPQLKQMNQALAKTNWQMCPVAGTVQVQEFFAMLGRREFPVANFIRVPAELDYLQQPDIFHEFFGHGPMLMEPIYADFMQWYGCQAQQLSPRAQRIFSRLFWYSIEFGLVQHTSGLRIYGGGILSSYAETKFCLESAEPLRISFDLEKVLQSDYNYQAIQQQYFILQSLRQLFELQDNPVLLEMVQAHSQGDTKPFINC